MIAIFKREFRSYMHNVSGFVFLSCLLLVAGVLCVALNVILGSSRFPVRRNARLQEVLSYISVDPDRANLSGLYIKRISTAKQQK